MSDLAADDLERVRYVATTCGLHDVEARPIARGVASVAWRVEKGDTSWVIRFQPEGSTRPITYASEHILMRRLRDAGCSTPRPIATSESAGVGVPGWRAWSVAESATGTAIGEGGSNPLIAEQLGRMLRVLHDFDATGFGPLRQGVETLEGSYSTDVDGIKARWLSASSWPFDGSSPSDSVFGCLPENVVSGLEALQADILDASHSAKQSVNHGDVHCEHVFQLGGALSCLIDFGGAFISTRAWDFAIMAVFFSWQHVESVMSGYGMSSREERDLVRRGELLSLAFAVYRLKVEVGLKSPASSLTAITRFIPATLERARRF